MISNHASLWFVSLNLKMIQIQIRLFDMVLQNQTWIDTYIVNFDNCFISMVEFHNFWYGDPY